jgi:hypothetical protein
MLQESHYESDSYVFYLPPLFFPIIQIYSNRNWTTLLSVARLQVT